MDVKCRVLLLKDYLEKVSDEKHPATTPEILKYLREKNCPITTQTLRTDIQSLLDAGYKITIKEASGLPTSYAWMSREWSAPEIRILVDAVASSQFLSNKKSRELIRKLSMLASPSVRSNLEPRFLFSERVKAHGDEVLATIQTIQKAVRQDRRISFNYWHYVPVKLESNEENQPDSGKKESEFLKKKPDDREKKLDVWEKDRILKTKGDRLIEHVVSPWYTVWNNDRYYLVGWSHKKNDIGVYRIDRIAAPKTDPNRKREKEPEGFNIREYTEQVFGMYTGTKTVVTLRCRHSILDQVIDKFGEEIKLENVTRDTFDITVPVHVAGTFYAWVVTYSGEMTIISPEGVCEAYVRYLNQSSDDVMRSDFIF